MKKIARQRKKSINIIWNYIKKVSSRGKCKRTDIFMWGFNINGKALSLYATCFEGNIMEWASHQTRRYTAYRFSNYKDALLFLQTSKEEFEAHGIPTRGKLEIESREHAPKAE